MNILTNAWISTKETFIALWWCFDLRQENTGHHFSPSTLFINFSLLYEGKHFYKTIALTEEIPTFIHRAIQTNVCSDFLKCCYFQSNL